VGKQRGLKEGWRGVLIISFEGEWKGEGEKRGKTWIGKE